MSHFVSWSLRQCWLLPLALAIACAPARALDPAKEFGHYVSNSWSIEQGLPQISALALAQDTQGYLWVGTQAGLARFDGHRFTAFSPDQYPELPGGWISALLAEPDGRLWVGTYRGLAQWADDRLQAVPSAPDLASGAAIHALARDADGQLLAATDEGVLALAEGRLQAHLRLPRPARALLVEPGGLWVGSVGGVYRQESGEPQWLAFGDESGNATVRALLRARGQLWAGTSEGLFVWTGGHWQRPADLPYLAGVPIEALLLDRNGSLWIAELAHLSRLRADGSSERIARDGAGLSVRSLFEDREGNLWLGSQWSGITRLRSGWTRRYGVGHGLANPLLWTVAEGSEGALWVGTDDGLARFQHGRFESVVEGSALPHPSVYTLRVEPERIWIGTRHGLAVLDQGVLRRPSRFEAVASLQINGVVRDARQRLWIATSGGLFLDEGEQLRQFAEAQGLVDPRVRYVLPREDGSLLLGTQSGLFEWRDNRVGPFPDQDGLPPRQDITVLHALPDGSLLAGSLSETLFLLRDGRWHVLDAAAGMPRNAPFFLAHDDSYLWAAGIRGVTRVPLADLRAVAEGRSRRVAGEMLLNERGDRRGGEKGFCCNGAGIAKGLWRGRQLWAPSREGLVVLDTHDVRPPESAPVSLVERVRIGTEWQSAPDGETLQIPAQSRDLGFEFTAISFWEPRSLGFRYRLLGYQEDWREPEEAGQRIVSYTNLPAGTYRFEVQASIREEQWSPAASIELRIAPGFRETAAFRALLAAALLLLVAGGYRWQRHRYRQRAAALEALVEQRTADLAQANLRLQEASLTDPLTGLRNRRYLTGQIPKDIAFYARELVQPHPQPRVILFALADIDHFKQINDTHGHAAGDRVLQQFAEVLMGQVRSGDYVARWGGEEFLLVFRPMPLAFLPVLGERLRAAVAAFPFDVGEGRSLQVTCSIGLCQYPLLSGDTIGLDWEQLLELADRALYRVKRSGRNGWGAYQALPGTCAADVQALLRAGDNALEASQQLRFVGSGIASG